ncbi:FAD-dependent oxidoreductase [Sphingomonas sp. KC8]|uniref:FAD-dependent oxidoreductase n=1 Tax=Sphingomonas sp. KC8 TaxID=1030157 RepID=UPI000248BE76|nr:FAD-dependent oxidoreductase [Sphingomonas sp. KC8]ARS26701.1 NADH-dependent oxidoreductase [Sphingomonas sp. KC8]
MTAQFAHLVAPGRIGPMAIRNRMLLTAMGTGLAEADGTCGERALAFNRQQAEGGIGLVTLGVVGVGWPIGGNMKGQPALSEDRHIPGIAAMAQAVQSHGARFAVQLHFGGLVGMEDMLAGRPAWTPSLPVAVEGDMMDGFLDDEAASAPFFQLRDVQYKVMTRDDIAALVEMFRAAADRARRAGVDGIEIHGGHGYIISSFLSPATNRREDEYGGSVANRARLLIEIIRAVRDGAGPDVAVWCKIDTEEYEREGGIRIAHALETARLAEAAGAHAITVTANHETSRGTLHSGSHTPQLPGLNVPKAAAIKRAVSIPVIFSGRIEPEDADAIIARGDGDFLGMGRKLLADPSLPAKIMQGDPASVLPCVYCYTCISAIYYGGSVRCAVNPHTAFEGQDWLPVATTPRHIAVIGGGPAGMETARRLALRGHRVTLIERSRMLGGTLRFASIAYDANERLLDWLIREIERSTVNVRLGEEASPELLRSIAADAIVVATGARRDLYSVPGDDRDHVLNGDDLRRLMLGEKASPGRTKLGWATRTIAKAGALTGATTRPALVREATKAWMPLGQRIVIIGGDLVGLELAEFLVHRGREVVILDDTAKFGRGLQIVRRWRVLDDLREAGVRFEPGVRDIAIDAKAVRATGANGESITFAADHVILARGAGADLRFAETLRAAGLEPQVVGDALGVGYIEGAMRSAAEIARIL